MREIQFPIVKITRVGQSPVIYVPRKLVRNGLVKTNTPYMVILREIESD